MCQCWGFIFMGISWLFPSSSRSMLSCRHAFLLEISHILSYFSYKCHYYIFQSLTIFLTVFLLEILKSSIIPYLRNLWPPGLFFAGWLEEEGDCATCFVAWEGSGQGHWPCPSLQGGSGLGAEGDQRRHQSWRKGLCSTTHFWVGF